MNKILYTLLALAFTHIGTHLYAQTNHAITIKNVRVTIRQNDTITLRSSGDMRGNINVVSGKSDAFHQALHNEGVIILTDTINTKVPYLFYTSSNPYLVNSAGDITNVQDLNNTYGKIIFTGMGSKNIRGADSIYLNSLKVEGSDLKLDTGVFIFGAVEMNNARINYQNQKVRFYDLGLLVNRYSGYLTNETETGYMFGNKSGFVEAYGNITGKGDTLFSLGKLNYGIKKVNLEYQFLRRQNIAQNITDTGINITYVLRPRDDASGVPGNSGFSGNLQINYLNKDVLGSPDQNTFRIWYLADNGRWVCKGGGKDKDNLIIEKNGINLLRGAYTIAEENCDVLPKIRFVGDTSVCKGSKIYITADTTGIHAPLYSWRTSVNALSPATASDSTKNYYEITAPDNMAGDSFLLYLTLTDVRGCHNTDSLRVHVRDVTPAAYTTMSAGVVKSFHCAHDTVFFNDTVFRYNEGAYRWTYAYQAKESSSYGNSYFVYPEANVYETALHYTNKYGCTSINKKSITIHPLPKPSFSTESVLCHGDTLLLFNATNINGIQAGNITHYEWSMGNGDTVHVKTDTVYKTTTNVFLSQKITPQGFRPSLSYKYDNPGSYAVRLKVSSNVCSADTNITIQVKPSVILSMDTTLADVCNGMESKLLAHMQNTGAVISQMNWHLPNRSGNDTVVGGLLNDTLVYQFPEAGKNLVLLKAVSLEACSDSIEAFINIKPSPQARFSANRHCVKKNTEIVNSSTISGLAIYLWNMNKEDTVNYTSDFSYLFATPGEKIIDLYIQQDNGCNDVFTDTLHVYNTPNVDFSTQNTCYSNQTNASMFINQSLNEQGNTYSWDFGDTYQSGQYTPVHVYTQSGTYKVGLSVVSKYGCQNYDTSNIIVFPEVIADFVRGKGITNVCFGENSSFTPSKNATSEHIRHYVWQFNDGLPNDTTNISSPSTSHQFSKAGAFNVRLQMLSDSGCVGESTKNIEIMPTPIIGFATQNVCDGQNATFKISDSSTVSLISSYKWDFGDPLAMANNASLLKEPTHVYSDTGDYHVQLEVISSWGCKALDTATIKVNTLPLINLGTDFSTCDASVELNAGGVNYNYLWQDNSTLSTHTASKSGKYAVTVTDISTGCKNSDAIQIKLNLPLSFTLGNDTSSCGMLRLNAPFLAGMKYDWSNGSKTFYADAHTSGTYHVKVTDNAGCTSSDTLYAEIFSNPTIDLGADTTLCIGDSLIIQAISPDITSWKWSTAATNDFITVHAGGIYGVKVTDINGCSSTDTRKVIFNPSPIVQLHSDTSLCTGETLLLNAGNKGQQFIWNTGNASQTLFASPGYTYSVTVINQYGCVGRDTVSISENTLPVIAILPAYKTCEQTFLLDAGYGSSSYKWNTGAVSQTITVNKSGVYYVEATSAQQCKSKSYTTVDFKTLPHALLPDNTMFCNNGKLDAGNIGATYLWSTGEASRVIEINESGEYSVIITNGNNCTITDSSNVVINNIEQANLGNDITLCNGDIQKINPQVSNNNYTYLWSNGKTASEIDVATAGLYRVTVTAQNGCTTTDDIQVVIKASPFVELGQDMTLCTHELITLDAGKDGVFYHWGSTNGIVSESRLYNVTDTGTYYVHVMNSDACSSYDTIHIRHTDMSIVPEFIHASEVKAGDTVAFINLSYPNPESYLWDFGDGTRSLEESPYHTYFRADSFQVAMHVSNGVCSGTLIKTVVVSGYLKSLDGGLIEQQENINGAVFIGINHALVYPNPVDNILHTEIDLTTEADIKVYIFSLWGVLMQTDLIGLSKNVTLSYDLSNYRPGIYLVKIVAGTDSRVFKVVKL